MNWVGGARNRLKVQNDRKHQKEFFEKQRFSSKVKRLEGATSPSGKKQAVSLDILSLQAAHFSAAKFRKAGADQKSAHLKRVNLDKSQGLFGHKFVDLPDASPESKPSILDFSRPSPARANEQFQGRHQLATITASHEDHTATDLSRNPRGLGHWPQSPINPWSDSGGSRRESRRPRYTGASTRQITTIKEEQPSLDYSTSENILLYGAEGRFGEASQEMRKREKTYMPTFSLVTPGSATSEFSSTSYVSCTEMTLDEATVPSTDDFSCEAAQEYTSKQIGHHHYPQCPPDANPQAPLPCNLQGAHAPTSGRMLASPADSSYSSFKDYHRIIQTDVIVPEAFIAGPSPPPLQRHQQDQQELQQLQQKQHHQRQQKQQPDKQQKQRQQQNQLQKPHQPQNEQKYQLQKQQHQQQQQQQQHNEQHIQPQQLEQQQQKWHGHRQQNQKQQQYQSRGAGAGVLQHDLTCHEITRFTSPEDSPRGPSHRMAEDKCARLPKGYQRPLESDKGAMLAGREGLNRSLLSWAHDGMPTKKVHHPWGHSTCSFDYHHQMNLDPSLQKYAADEQLCKRQAISSQSQYPQIKPNRSSENRQDNNGTELIDYHESGHEDTEAVCSGQSSGCVSSELISSGEEMDVSQHNWLGFVRGGCQLEKDHTSTCQQSDQSALELHTGTFSKGSISSSAQHMLDEVLALDKEIQEGNGSDSMPSLCTAKIRTFGLEIMSVHSTHDEQHSECKFDKHAVPILCENQATPGDDMTPPMNENSSRVEGESEDVSGSRTILDQIIDAPPYMDKRHILNAKADTNRLKQVDAPGKLKSLEESSGSIHGANAGSASCSADEQEGKTAPSSTSCSIKTESPDDRRHRTQDNVMRCHDELTQTDENVVSLGGTQTKTGIGAMTCGTQTQTSPLGCCSHMMSKGKAYDKLQENSTQTETETVNTPSGGQTLSRKQEKCFCSPSIPTSTSAPSEPLQNQSTGSSVSDAAVHCMLIGSPLHTKPHQRSCAEESASPICDEGFSLPTTTVTEQLCSSMQATSSSQDSDVYDSCQSSQ